uniref:Uncharacterized protein n=1 Tax=Tetraselmis sp. GSL018 TaxID=582737 RepID=A0A061QXB6_9CHLO
MENSFTVSLWNPKEQSDILGQCMSLEKHIFGKADCWTGGLFERELSKRSSKLFYIGDNDSKVLAYVACSISSLKFEIGKLAVKPENR